MPDIGLDFHGMANENPHKVIIVVARIQTCRVKRLITPYMEKIIVSRGQ